MNRWMKRMCGAAIVMAIPCLAQEAGSRPCTPAMLKGAYLVTISGTRPAPRVAPGGTGMVGTIEAVTGVFLQMFDGKGGLTQASQVVVKGAISGLFPDEPGAGTYDLDANCTGSFTVRLPQLAAPLENRMIVFDNGRRFKAVVVAPQALMISVEGVRVD
ncbi:MAG: hypothetical protein JNL98_18905 [Bryobacterales bacterium]|nr:hypothetical protein [Bryobacterales bacterium]